MKRYVPHAALVTVVVIVLPPVLVSWLLKPTGTGTLVVAAILSISLSVALAHVGSHLWARRFASRDVVFADLMPWGWVRRVRAERRLAHARQILGRAGGAADPELQIRTLIEVSKRLEARDPMTHGHSRRVARHAEAIARGLHLPAAEVAKIRTAAALHDVGKIETPRPILNKPGRLTEAEFAVIARHPVDGAEMLLGIDDAEIIAMVRHHHERLDGGGYPDGLTGREIPLGARIISVADTFDAITSTRSYRKGSRHKPALDILAGEAGAQLDPAAVAAFLGYYRGRRDVAWWSFGSALPERLLAWLANGSGSLTGAGAGAAQGALALGGVALVASLPAALSGAPLASADAGARPLTAQLPSFVAARNEVAQSSAAPTALAGGPAAVPGAPDAGAPATRPGPNLPGRHPGGFAEPGGSGKPGGPAKPGAARTGAAPAGGGTPTPTSAPATPGTLVANVAAAPTNGGNQPAPPTTTHTTSVSSRTTTATSTTVASTTSAAPAPASAPPATSSTSSSTARTSAATTTAAAQTATSSAPASGTTVVAISSPVPVKLPTVSVAGITVTTGPTISVSASLPLPAVTAPVVKVVSGTTAAVTSALPATGKALGSVLGSVLGR